MSMKVVIDCVKAWEHITTHQCKWLLSDGYDLYMFSFLEMSSDKDLGYGSKGDKSA